MTAAAAAERRQLGRTSPAQRHLRIARSRPQRRSSPVVRFVPPEAAALAFTADRGWHLTPAPPGWFLDLLAELE